MNNSLKSICENGHINLLLDLIEVCPNILNNSSRMSDALLSACKGGHVDIVEYLLSFGTKIDVGYIAFAIDNAIRADDLEIVKYLFDNELKNVCYLHLAVKLGHFEIVKYIIEENKNPFDLEEVFYMACENGHFEIVKYLIENENKNEIIQLKSLRVASARSFQTFVETLKKKDHRNAKAFNLAYKSNHLEIVKYLIQDGYERKSPINIHEHNEFIFRFVCAKGYIEMAKYLFETSLNVQSINIHANNECAFLMACKNGHLETVKYLFEMSSTHDQKLIDIHVNNEQAFCSACENGDLEMIKYLLEIGEESKSPINIHTNNDLAFRRACENGHLKVIKYLVQLSERNGICGMIDIHAENNSIFRNTSDIKVIKYLFQLLRKNECE